MDSVAKRLDLEQRPAGGDHLPPPSPLAVPTQSLSDWPEGRARRPWRTAHNVTWARAFVLGSTLVLTAIGTYEVYKVIAVSGVTWLQAVFAIFFAMTFAWIAFAAASAYLGFWRILCGVQFVPDVPTDGPMGRTALLMPVYNEEPRRILDTLLGMAGELKRLGAEADFDIFVLSDSSDPVIVDRERDCFETLHARLSGSMNVYYRRRQSNRHRKAGNIEDFVRRFGGAYDHMIVLDADSTMSGIALVGLARLMHRDETAGIIQTLPVLRNRTSLYGRMQQFSSRVYGPVVSEGLAAWHGRDGNYWGHNAIIRVRAFAEAAGLPELPGRRPLGGHVLSHDFVEAALMRRAGWAVYMVPDLPGSYEECPPSLIELAGRDRRWCQGNLQHAKILGAKGLSWVSRLHLLQGIMSYLASPLWLAFLLLGLGLSAQAQYIRPEYFPDGFALFPRWPVFDPERALRLFVFTMVVLFLPKVLAVILAIKDAKLRRGCGGTMGVVASLIAETALSLLISPVAMLIQSRFVADIVAGRDSGWAKQNRTEAELSFRAALKWHWGHVGAGAAIGLAAFSVSWHTFLWLLPLTLGLLFSAAVSWATASSAFGLVARRLGIFVTPEESTGPADETPEPMREPAPQPAE